MRPSIVTYFSDMASLVATRATCARRQVGCILTNKRNHVLATGYNGVAAGRPHCIDNKCAGALFPSGSGLDKCEAIHAEQNAMLQCRDVHEIYACYATTAPCITCTKLLLNTSCQEIYFIEDYPQAKASKKLWEDAGREWHSIYEDK